MSENVRELVEAAKELLEIIKDIPNVPLNSILQAWDRVYKAIQALEAQEGNEDDPTRD